MCQFPKNKPIFKINQLENVWAKVKYNVLAKDPATYHQIRQLLKDKQTDCREVFFDRLVTVLSKKNEEVSVGVAQNAFLHVWGYFNDKATPDEKITCLRAINGYTGYLEEEWMIKQQLKELADKYEQTYLQVSYYFLPDNQVIKEIEKARGISYNQ